MVGTAMAMGALLLMAGPSKMTTMNSSSSNVDGKIVVSSNPPPTEQMFDPSQNYCYKDNDYADKYCWDPVAHLLSGNWKEDGGHGYNDCGPECTPSLYDPSITQWHLL